MLLTAVNNHAIAISSGPTLQIWTLTPSKQWSVSTEFTYQSLTVLQLIPNTHLRLKVNAMKKDRKYLVCLHKGGYVSYWD